MFDHKSLLNQFINMGSSMMNAQNTQNNQNAAPSAGVDPIMQGLLSGVGGGMLGNLLGSGGKTSMVNKLGGAAAIATLAYRAYQNYQQNQTGQSQQMQQQFASPQSASLDFDTVSEVSEEESRAMLIAMINAAKADGVYDERERQMLNEQLQKISNDPEAVAWMQNEIKKPLDPNYVAAQATSPQIASEIYLTTLVMCQQPNEKERQYLDALAAALQISDDLKIMIEQQLG